MKCYVCDLGCFDTSSICDRHRLEFHGGKVDYDKYCEIMKRKDVKIE